MYQLETNLKFLVDSFCLTCEHHSSYFFFLGQKSVQHQSIQPPAATRQGKSYSYLSYLWLSLTLKQGLSLYGFNGFILLSVFPLKRKNEYWFDCHLYKRQMIPKYFEHSCHLQFPCNKFLCRIFFPSRHFLLCGIMIGICSLTQRMNICFAIYNITNVCQIAHMLNVFALKKCRQLSSANECTIYTFMESNFSQS